MKAFIDTSFLLSIFLGNKKVKILYDRIYKNELYTSVNVIEETTYYTDETYCSKPAWHIFPL